MPRKDYMNTEDGDLYFDPTTGDLVVVDSDEQHIKDIIELTKGGLREFPIMGVDAIKFRNSTNRRTEFERVVKEQLRADGYNGVKLRFNGSGLDDFTIII